MRNQRVSAAVLIHLHEDESREEVTLYSVPGLMQEVTWLAERITSSDKRPRPPPRP